MIRTDLYIDRYDWDIRALFDVEARDLPYVSQCLREVHATPDILARVREIIRPDNYNYGITRSCATCRKTLIVIGRTTSIGELINSIAHEIRHLVDDIASVNGMALKGEEVGYLTGFVADKLTKGIKDRVCSCK